MDALVHYFVHVEIIHFYGVNWSYGRIIICSFHRKEC